jgi:hypothetical protein
MAFEVEGSYEPTRQNASPTTSDTAQEQWSTVMGQLEPSLLLKISLWVTAIGPRGSLPRHLNSVFGAGPSSAACVDARRFSFGRTVPLCAAILCVPFQFDAQEREYYGRKSVSTLRRRRPAHANLI